MRIVLTLDAWAQPGQRIDLDIGKYTRRQAIAGLKKLAILTFGDAYIRLGHASDAASPHIDKFFELLGAEPADQVLRFYDERDGLYEGPRLRIETTTSETEERRAIATQRFLDNALGNSTAGRLRLIEPAACA